MRNQFLFLSYIRAIIASFDKTEFDHRESYKPLEEIINNSKNDNLVAIGDFNTEKLYNIIQKIKCNSTCKIDNFSDHYIMCSELLINDKKRKSHLD